MIHWCSIEEQNQIVMTIKIAAFSRSLSVLFFIALTSACHQNQQTTVAVNDTTKTVQSTPKTSLLLLPGQSAGEISLGQDVIEVLKILGKADSSDAAMQKTVAFWYQGHDRDSASFAIYTARDTSDHPLARIKQIRLTSPKYQTKDGLGVSSPLAALKNKFEFKKINAVNDAGKKYEIYDSTKGIAFEMGQKGNCTAIIIHPKNEPLTATYLPLR